MNLSLSEKTSALWKISFVAGMLNVIANVIFVPFYGIYAAAISTFGSLLYMGFAGFFLKSYRSLPQVDHYPLLWIALISTLSLAAYLLKDAQPVTKLLITAAILSVNAVLLWKNFHRIQQIKV